MHGLYCDTVRERGGQHGVAELVRFSEPRAVLSDLLELAELQLETMLCYDGRGRMTTWNDEPRSRPPWLFALRTELGTSWRLHANLPESLAAELGALLAAESGSRDFAKEPDCAAALREALRPHVETVSEYRGPAFVLPAMPEPDPQIEFDSTQLLARLRVDGQVVASCECARLGLRAAEAGVETAPTFRGRGFAARVVARWARAIQDSGRAAFYSTWWENEPSRAVARKLGARCYGEDFHLDGPR
jgi:RimJ/RimL family protein N-acetyltransferase